MKKDIFIIGSGPGDIKQLTQRAIELFNSCEEIYSFDRFYELFKNFRNDIIKCNYAEIIKKIETSKARSIAVLVSGDVGFFSMRKTLVEKLEDRYRVESICGISSLQYFCAKIGIGYENIDIVSLHGREKSILGYLAYNRYTFVLTGGDNNASSILENLYKLGIYNINVIAGEMLSMSKERFIKGTVSDLYQYDFDNMTVLLFENKNYINKENMLFDKEFFRNKTPMTKQEVRWVSVNMLKIKPTDIVFDIGAGSGSVAIEMARKAYNRIVYAFEKDIEAYTLLYDNKKALGALNLIPVFGEALEELKNLPVPDKVFIGGSKGRLREMILYLYKINPEILIVINAITLETLSVAINIFKELNLNVDVTCLNCAKNMTKGDCNLMMANNPVYIIRKG
ncbi:MAG: precorrin-6y C5,15-methyltransferase (decarboxylating) subunit CbiE [Clostridiales bacterium]